MNRIYDIESDQLKCNFCTNYFKCSLQFANVQRYSLKACHKCLNNFTYSIIHPTTHQIYRVLLLDVGIALPIACDGQDAKAKEGARVEMELLREEMKSKISLYFEEKISAMMREANKIKQNLQKTFQKVEKDYAAAFQKTYLLSPNDRSHELSSILSRLKDYDINAIIAQKGKLLTKEKSAAKDLLQKSTRKSPNLRLEKENIQSTNCSNVSKLMKSKICGSSSRLLTHSKSKEFSQSRISKSIIKSIKLDQSIDIPPYYHFQENDRSEVSKMLEQKSTFQTYMSREVTKMSNVCLKSEGSRNQVQSVLEMRRKTATTTEIIELIGGDASKTNFGCYLKALKDFRDVKTVRMIRCCLVDADMDHLLHFLSDSPEVETLIVTNNRLSQLSIQALYTFKQRHPSSRLANVYMGNNYIPTYKSNHLIKKQQNTQICIHL